MYDADHIYGLDLETDNSEGFGLDPRKSGITLATVSTKAEDYAFDGEEGKVLNTLNELFNDLDAGLVTTWNGTHFDLPVLDTRAKLYEFTNPEGAFMLELIPQPGLKPKYDYCPGRTTGYTGLWHRSSNSGGLMIEPSHAHFDVAYAYKAYAESFGLFPDENGKARPVVPWSLKPVCKQLGIEMIEIDRANLHLYTPEEVRGYGMSDAVGTRILTTRLLGA